MRAQPVQGCHVRDPRRYRRLLLIAPGLDPDTTPALVSGDYQATSAPESLTAALWHGGVPCAGGGGYHVITKRVNSISVEDDPVADGSVTVADNTDAQSSSVSFVIAIP